MAGSELAGHHFLRSATPGPSQLSTLLETTPWRRHDLWFAHSKEDQQAPCMVPLAVPGSILRTT
jgi:hypothetical protein